MSSSISRKWLAIAVVAIIVVASVGYYLWSGTAETGPVTLVVSDGWNEAPYLPVMKEMREEYMALNPNIDFDWRQVLYADQVKQFAADKAAGTVPDIVNTYISPMAVFYQNDDLLPLDDLVQQLGGTEYFHKGALDAYTWDGHTWGIPHQFSTFYILYRKDLFAQHGIPVPQTWDDILAAAEKLTYVDPSTGKNIYGFGFVTSRTYMPGDFWMTFIRGNGGYLLDKDANVVIDSPQAIEALKFLKELSKYNAPDANTWGWAEMQRKWWEGGLAMEGFAGLTALDLAYQNNREIAANTGIFSVPYGPSGGPDKVGPYYMRGATSGWIVTKQSQHPEEAKAFLKWMFTQENFFKIASKTIPTRYLGSMKWMDTYQPYWDLPSVKFYEDALKTYVNEVVPHNLDPVMSSGVFNPDVPRLISALTLTDLIQEIVYKDTPVEQAVREYKAIMEQTLAS